MNSDAYLFLIASPILPSHDGLSSITEIEFILPDDWGLKFLTSLSQETSINKTRKL